MTPETDDPKQDDRLIVWDLPLRLFHWGLAAAVIISVVSVNMGRMDIHERSGLTVLALVAFRIIWGFGGGHHAGSRFVRSPSPWSDGFARRVPPTRRDLPGTALWLRCR